MVIELFEYVKFDGDVHFFCFRPFFASFIEEICWHFDVTGLTSQQFTRRDLKAVAFLVLPYKAVLHAFFFSFILFQQTILIFWNKFSPKKNVFFSFFYFNFNKQFWYFGTNFPQKRILPVKNRKNERRHWIVHTRITLSCKFQLKLKILFFWNKFVQKEYLIIIIILYSNKWIRKGFTKSHIINYTDYLHRKKSNKFTNGKIFNKYAN